MFIKNYRDTDNPKVRDAYGMVAGIFGILSNILIFVGKIIIGLLTSSITIIVDAVNSLTDAGSSLLTIVGFKLSSKPADKEHPFGHARIEYVMALFIALLTFAAGLLFAKSCIEKIITPAEIIISTATYIILTITIAIKLFQIFLFRDFGKSIDSDSLLATYDDARADLLTNIAVLISVIVMDIFNLNIDGYIGLAVSLFIIYTAIRMIKSTIGPLISEKPQKRFVNKIKKEILSFTGVDDVHDLLIHSYGAGTTFATFHIEVQPTATLLDTHILVDKIERHLEDKFNLNVTIQVDPIDKDNPKTKEIFQRVKKTLKKINKKLSIHSLRVVYKNNVADVLFDVLEDFNISYPKKEILKQLNKEFENEDMKYNFIFTIEKPFV